MSVFMFDTREVSVGVENVPDLYTPGGKAPITPYHVRIKYDIPEREVMSIVVLGNPPPSAATSWRINRNHVRRRVDEANAPVWLKELIERFRPLGQSGESADAL